MSQGPAYTQPPACTKPAGLGVPDIADMFPFKQTELATRGRLVTLSRGRRGRRYWQSVGNAFFPRG